MRYQISKTNRQQLINSDAIAMHSHLYGEIWVTILF